MADTLWAACDDCDKWRVVTPAMHAKLQAGGDDSKFQCLDIDKLCDDPQLDDMEGADRFRDMLKIIRQQEIGELWFGFDVLFYSGMFGGPTKSSSVVLCMCVYFMVCVCVV